MMQLKAIFSHPLRRYEFELVNRPRRYVDDVSKMIVLPMKRRAPVRSIDAARSRRA
jgi:hypothetical protein